MALLKLDQLHHYIADALRASGVSHSNADSVAHALSQAQRDGKLGHGVSRVASYCAQARSGKVDGTAKPIMTKRGSVLRVDACNGFAYPALDLAMEGLVECVANQGVAVCGVYNSHHCGVLGLSVERLAQKGLVAMMLANSPAAMAPYGGDTAIFGTNPIAFACPRGADKPPLVIDLSLSEVARGKVMLAKREGRQIPFGWGLNSEGRPTSDPSEVLNGGSMIPAGGVKGSALALMVELLIAALVGAKPAFQASSFFESSGDPPGVGQWLLVLQPTFFRDGSFLERVEMILDAMIQQPNVRIPGQTIAEARKKERVWLSDADLDEIRHLANFN